MENNQHYLQQELYERIQSGPDTFNRLIQDTLDGIWYWNLESPEDGWTDNRFWEALGYDPTARSHKSEEWQNLAHPEDLKQANGHLAKHMDDPEHPFDQIVRYKQSDGTLAQVRSRGTALRDPKGKPIRMLGLHQKLPHPQDKERQLLEANQKLHQRVRELENKNQQLHQELENNRLIRGAFEQAAIGFGLVDSQARFRKVNTATCEMSGYSMEEFELLTVHDLAPEFPKEVWPQFWQQLQSEKFLHIETDYLHKDGSLLPMEIDINYLEMNGLGYAIAFPRRIEESKEWEAHQESLPSEQGTNLLRRNKRQKNSRQLDQENQLTKFALEHAAPAFFLLNSEARILRANSAAHAQSGHTTEELLEMTIQDLNPDSTMESWREFWSELHEMGFLRFEATHRHATGKTYPVEIESNYFKYNGENYCVTFARDISHRKRLQESKERLQIELEKRIRELLHQRRDALTLADDADAARARAEAAERQLAKVTDELSLPQMDAAEFTDKIFIEKLTLNEVMVAGRMIRALCRKHDNFQTYAEGLTQFLHKKFFDQEVAPAFDMVLLHCTLPYENLKEEQQELARKILPDISNSTLCLVQETLCCENKSWEEHAATMDQIIPISEELIWEANPLLACLACQLGHCICRGSNICPSLHDDYIASVHIEDTSSDNWPLSQMDAFVLKGLRSMVGFAHKLSEDREFLLTVYSQSTIHPESAKVFVHLSHSVRLGLLQYIENPQRTVTQIKAVDSLLRGHEAFAAEQEKHLLKTMSELTKANSELHRSNEELDKFASAASHDLKSPLFAIQNLIDMIDEDIGDQLPPETKELFQKLVKRAHHMEDLLESLLNYSRIGHSEDVPTEQSIREILETVRGLLNAPEQIKITFPEKLPHLVAPRGALLRVFGNLISNAIKHGENPNLHIKVSYKDHGKHYAFTIADNGIGIDPQHHHLIFEMFQALKSKHQYGGSGMGLTLVKKTVEHFGGTISLASSPDQGAQFTFTWLKQDPHGESHMPQ